METGAELLRCWVSGQDALFPALHAPRAPTKEEGRGVRRWGTWKRWIRMVHALTAAPTAPARAEAWERLAVEESGFIVGQQALAWEAPHLSPGDPLASCLPVLLRVRL